MPHLRHRAKKDDEKRPSPDEQKAPENRFSGLKPMHREPDEEQPTREERAGGTKRGSVEKFPPMLG